MQDAITNLEIATANLANVPPLRQLATVQIEAAVNDLETAAIEGLNAVQANELEDHLAGVARQLAVDAIDEAIAGGVDPSKITDAEQFLFDGDWLRTSQMYADAVYEYQNAIAAAASGPPTIVPFLSQWGMATMAMLMIVIASRIWQKRGLPPFAG